MILNFRVSHEENTQIRSQAQAAGLSISEFLRTRVFPSDSPTTAPAAQKPTKAPKSPRTPPLSAPETTTPIQTRLRILCACGQTNFNSTTCTRCGQPL